MIDYITPGTKLWCVSTHAPQVSKQVKAIEVLDGERVFIERKPGHFSIVPFARLRVSCNACNGEGVVYIDITRKWNTESQHRQETCLICNGRSWLALNEHKPLHQGNLILSYTPGQLRRVNTGHSNQSFSSGKLGW